MLLITGVESDVSSNKQKATKNRIDRGVAGRSMMATNGQHDCCEDPARQRPARETRCGGSGDGGNGGGGERLVQ